ncbi:MAG TPA: PPOX class F420-dependent oxidoreductase [Acidimicrobiales bacterium]|nr:PPOX class F420-dependent oxidoreductase [Acidimicrobiales bacterium]
MDAEEARRFIAENHRAVLATQRADGQPQLSPVAAVVDEAGLVVVSSRETAVKVRNLRRHPRAWLVALSDSWYGPMAQVEGPVEVVSLPDAMDGLVEYYRRAAGDHPDWDEYRAAMQRERRVLLRLTIDRAGPNRSG